MHCKTAKYKNLLLVWMLVAGTLSAMAQEDKPVHPAIDSAMAISPDYLPTRHANLPTNDFNPLTYKTIDTTLYHISEFDPLLEISNLYQSLGINGQAHKRMIFDIDHTMGFHGITLPYPLYFKRMEDLQIYDLKTSYTDLSFIYSVLKTFSLHATHAQHVRQADFVVNLDGASNPGYFLHQGINRTSLSAIARYETPNRLYGMLLAYAFNHGKYAENGGLENSLDFTDRNPRTDSTITYDLESFPVMFANAATRINTHALQLTNYLNLRDNKGHYFGTLTHTFNFDFLSSHFTDHTLNNLFYQDRYYFNTDTTNDSLRYYTIANSLQWSNYSPIDTVNEQSAYFFRFAGGVRHEYANTLSPHYIGNSMTLFARTNIRLFKVWDIYGDFSYSFFGYTRNDARARAGFRFTINKAHRNYLGLEASFNRYAPDFIFSHYLGNNNQWDHDWAKQNIFKAGAYWTIFDYRAGFNFYNLGRLVYLNSRFEPVQLEKAAQVVQLTLHAPVRTKYFALDAELALQHSTNKAVTVPLFAGKMSALYTSRIFKKRLRIQVGVDVFYHTLYYADGYNPLLHQFYTQDALLTGNYLYLNAHFAFRVKRISFFLRGGNLLAGLFNFRYITTPGYPMQGRSLELGINWKFYD
ncbi:MAG: hypothetical protein IKN78_08570 [Bacteroidales bacterium]|nr:hypothetical protein [Bacteroidales bacterium]